MPDSRKCGGGKSGDRSKNPKVDFKKKYLTDFPVLAGTLACLIAAQCLINAQVGKFVKK